MKAHALIATLFALLLLLTACGTTPAETTPQATTPAETTPVVTTPAATEPTETTQPRDPFAALRTGEEVWITYGLAAYESGKTPEDLRSFFANAANTVYLTLYDHMFTYDPARSVPVAEALFRFIYDTYGAEALADWDRRIEYKNAYLQSLGLPAAYNQPEEVERTLAGMEFSSAEPYPYVITLENATYYFEDFDDGYISQYHGFLYFNTVGLRQMTAYLRAKGGEALLDIDRPLRFYMTFDQTPYSSTTPAGDMKINDFAAALHEAVHAMGVRGDEHIWLAEGLCDYFGKTLGFNEQITARYLQMLMVAEQGYYDEAAAAGDASAQLTLAILAHYKGWGGVCTSLAEFDLPLFFDALARAEQEMGRYTTLGDAYRSVNQKECTKIGRELSYAQAASLVAYLVDTYGLDAVMEAQTTQNVEQALGKNYETLKSDWIAYLEERSAEHEGV